MAAPEKPFEFKLDKSEKTYLVGFFTLRQHLIFCANDEYACGDLPGIAFLRTGTLANGADRCDFELKLI